MTLLVKCSLHRSKDLNSDPQHHVKAGCDGSTWLQCRGRQGETGLMGQQVWLNCEFQVQCETLYQKKIRWKNHWERCQCTEKDVRASTCTHTSTHLRTHLHTHACTHTYLCTHEFLHIVAQNLYDAEFCYASCWNGKLIWDKIIREFYSKN